MFEYNFKDIVKLLYELDNIYTRQTHAELYQMSQVEVL